MVWLPAPALAVTVRPNRPPATGLPWLLVAHGRIVNELGQTVILRGFNDAALLQTGSQALPAPLSARDAALMESQGFNVVRIPVSWSMLEPTPGHFSQAYLDQVRAMVALCASHGLYSVLDMHTEDFGVGFGGSGAPSWLSVPGIPDIHFPGLQAAWVAPSWAAGWRPIRDSARDRGRQRVQAPGRRPSPCFEISVG